MNNTNERSVAWSSQTTTEEARAVIGAMLAKARRDLRLTQQQVADRLGCHQAHVRSMEKGRRRISITALFQYAAACGKSLNIVLE